MSENANIQGSNDLDPERILKRRKSTNWRHARRIWGALALGSVMIALYGATGAKRWAWFGLGFFLVIPIHACLDRLGPGRKRQ